MGMENNPMGFFVMIVQTISMILLWMITNVFFGLYLGYAFFDDINWKNILYYVFFIVSLVFLVRYIRRKWNF
jgi:hypothetical protein